jgi:uncharacterized protein
MTAIKIHHTATSEASWDGPAAKANLNNDAEEAYYRKAFAWEDPKGDPKTKKAYKFIHHEVASYGTIGAANVKGCETGIGVLNGAMGGANIPGADRQGVWEHLAAHLKDAKVTPAELNGKGAEVDITYSNEIGHGDAVPQRVEGEVERRFLENEVRAGEAGAAPVISGMAAVYNRETVIGGMFREVIRPGAFTRVLSENPDVVGAPNHNWDVVLGRTIAGTLKLEDRESNGLHYDIQVNPNDQEAMNFYSRVQRGDVRHSSFAFTVRKELWTNPANPQDLPLRAVLEVDSLFDVSPVTFPAYPTTSASARSRVEAIQQEMEQASQAASGGAEGQASQVERRRKARIRRLQLLDRKK